MSTNHTEHFNLCQWEANDKVLRSDFNADNQKIDAALKANADAIALKADSSALSALAASTQSALAGKADLSAVPKIATGTYTGNGAASQTINLGFSPQAVYICTRGGVAGIAPGSEYCYGGLAFEQHPLMLSAQKAAEITETGFKVYRPSDYFRVNTSGTVYYYIAFH